MSNRLVHSIPKEEQKDRQIQSGSKKATVLRSGWNREDQLELLNRAAWAVAVEPANKGSDRPKQLNRISERIPHRLLGGLANELKKIDTYPDWKIPCTTVQEAFPHTLVEGALIEIVFLKRRGLKGALTGLFGPQNNSGTG